MWTTSALSVSEPASLVIVNLKLAKKIRQGMREMAQVHTGGAIRGRWPDDYEGEIPRNSKGELWQTEKTDGTGTKTIVPTRIVVRLKLISPRQIYKRAKRMVK